MQVIQTRRGTTAERMNEWRTQQREWTNEGQRN